MQPAILGYRRPAGTQLAFGRRVHVCEDFDNRNLDKCHRSLYKVRFKEVVFVNKAQSL